MMEGMANVYCPSCGSEFPTNADRDEHKEDCALAWRDERDDLRRRLARALCPGFVPFMDVDERCCHCDAPVEEHAP